MIVKFTSLTTKFATKFVVRIISFHCIFTELINLIMKKRERRILNRMNNFEIFWLNFSSIDY